jgi:predicted nucleic acid-binding protein
VAFLFDTDAISEVLRRRPQRNYVAWLASIPRSEQFTSAVSIGELYKGAFRSADPDFHIERIDKQVMPAITVLAYDVMVARVYGEIEAEMHRRRTPLADADLQIAATALHHGLELVTGNVRHFMRIPHLSISTVLADTRRT